jgi:hypothetical protein
VIKLVEITLDGLKKAVEVFKIVLECVGIAVGIEILVNINNWITVLSRYL